MDMRQVSDVFYPQYMIYLCMYVVWCQNEKKIISLKCNGQHCISIADEIEICF